MSLTVSLEQIRTGLQKCFSLTLPGMEAQLKLAPAHRKSEIQDLFKIEAAVKSSVMILFYEKNEEVFVVFIKRPVYNGVHSGQIAFPGGRWESTDRSMYHTALRETREEIGIETSKIKLAGKLSDLYIPPSNYIVSPFVGIYQGICQFNPDPSEVAGILEIPFEFFLQPNAVKTAEIKLPTHSSISTPAFIFRGHVIWGATAMILNELLELWKSTDQ